MATILTRVVASLVLELVALTAQAQLPTVTSGKPDIKQQYADLGDFTVGSGQKILDCKIGYRTFGKLNEAKSNTVLFLCGLANTSAMLQTFVPNVLVDTTKFHLVLIDALANGVSSSPSNSVKQPRLAFPQITIRDMVDTQHKLLMEKLGIRHLAAVGGLSMGAMQSYQWAASYPDFMDKVIACIGTPKASMNELVWLSTMVDAIRTHPDYKNGNYQGKINIPVASHILQLVYSTPEFLATKIPAETFESWYNTTGSQALMDWNNMVVQLEGVKDHDVTKTTKGSLEEAANVIKATMLVFVNKQDHAVEYHYARDFADLTHARYIEIDSPDGHGLKALPIKEVREFLAK